jgi:hypothetical protein
MAVVVAMLITALIAVVIAVLIAVLIAMQEKQTHRLDSPVRHLVCRALRALGCRSLLLDQRNAGLRQLGDEQL